MILLIGQKKEVMSTNTYSAWCVNCTHSYDEWGGSSSNYYYLQKWRINGQYYGKPDAPKIISSQLGSDTLFVKFGKNEENNVSYYKMFFLNSEEEVIDSLQTDNSSDTTYQWLMINSSIQKIKMTAITNENISSNYSEICNIISTAIDKKELQDVCSIFVLKTDLSIYNLNGQKITTLQNADLPSGKYNYRWHAENMSSGIYIINLSGNSRTQIKKCMLLK